MTLPEQLTLDDHTLADHRAAGHTVKTRICGLWWYVTIRTPQDTALYKLTAATCAGGFTMTGHRIA